MARPGEVLITSKTYDEADARSEPVGMQLNGPFTLQVRGRTELVTIYVSADPAIDEGSSDSSFTVRHFRVPETSLAR